MRKALVNFCILLFAIRVFFIPLFFPFNTNGFWLQASVAAVCLFIASALMAKGCKKIWVWLVIFIVAIVDFLFFLLAKESWSGNFPYYPRYVLMSLPLVLALFTSNFKING